MQNSYLVIKVNLIQIVNVNLLKKIYIGVIVLYVERLLRINLMLESFQLMILASSALDRNAP